MKMRIFTTFLALALIFSSTPPIAAATISSYAGAVTTEYSPLNVRSGPSTTLPVITTLPKGSHITLLQRSGSWWYVEYAENRFGYCHANYITPIEGTPAKVTAWNLNVRNSRGTSFAIKDVLSKDDIVIVLNTQSGWSRILYHGTKTGYVSAAYLSGGQTQILLNIPDFKQYDSRWANKTISQSGKTFSQIGCATTAIAMLESYRTGSVTLPDEMAKSLRYTKDGSVYWPSHYKVTTDSTNYLEKIRTFLGQGKPVLFGAKNTSGKQHWVVITGYTGSALSPADFTILDPGSSIRTNLQHFLNAYPVFYKYFSY